ncbi:hypothetical protein ACP6EW_01875 [Hafnia paralvei]|uniref:hypothetical protein n=1 Tax=Hafnia paralvei TaxID=546367 RepID=UPI003CEFF154
MMTALLVLSFSCFLLVFFIENQDGALYQLRKEARERERNGRPSLRGGGCLNIDGKTYDMNGSEFIDH